MSSGGDSTDLLTVKNFIDGAFVDSDTFIESVDPSTAQVWAQIPDSGEREVENAVSAASKAFPSWSAKTAQERSTLLFRIAEIIESRLDEFAKLESRDQGKPIWLASTVDIPRAVHNFRFFASYILHDLNRSRLQEPTGAVQYTLKEPLGVAGLISPWNLPLYLLSFKIAPAMAAGNTVVAKPSELTSVTAYKLCEVIKEAGVPPGVVNMVFGRGDRVGACLAAHPKVPLISFTGGTATGTKIRMAALNSCKKLSLELGGKNAAIVFNDADLDKCIATCIRSSFINQGEVCLCTSRIFVHQAIYETFLKKFIEKANELKVGDPKDDVFMGPLVSRDHMSKVLNAVEEARKSGATIHTREAVLRQELPQFCQAGYFVPPIVITDAADTSTAMQEEIFGPVTCVVPFSTEEEVVTRANNVKYGLCASLWTSDLSRAHRVSRLLQVGTVWVNCWLVRDLNLPFGGFKESGIGREGGLDSMDFFTQKKTVCLLI